MKQREKQTENKQILNGLWGIKHTYNENSKKQGESGQKI